MNHKLKSPLLWEHKKPDSSKSVGRFRKPSHQRPYPITSLTSRKRPSTSQSHSAEGRDLCASFGPIHFQRSCPQTGIFLLVLGALMGLDSLAAQETTAVAAWAGRHQWYPSQSPQSEWIIIPALIFYLGRERVDPLFQSSQY